MQSENNVKTQGEQSPLQTTEMMLKALFCTGAKLKLREQCFGLSKKKSSFIALPGKGGHSALLPLKTMSPNPEEFYEEFYIKGSRVELLTR